MCGNSTIKQTLNIESQLFAIYFQIFRIDVGSPMDLALSVHFIEYLQGYLDVAFMAVACLKWIQ